MDSDRLILLACNVQSDDLCKEICAMTRGNDINIDGVTCMCAADGQTTLKREDMCKKP